MRQHCCTKHSALSSAETNIVAELSQNHWQFKDQNWSVKFTIKHLCDLGQLIVSLGLNFYLYKSERLDDLFLFF